MMVKFCGGGGMMVKIYDADNLWWWWWEDGEKLWWWRNDGEHCDDGDDGMAVKSGGYGEDCDHDGDGGIGDGRMNHLVDLW